jgi:hypothetical protein
LERAITFVLPAFRVFRQSRPLLEAWRWAVRQLRLLPGAGRWVARLPQQLLDPARWDPASLSHRPRRRSYRQHLARSFWLRYVACSAVMAAALAAALAAGSLMLILGVALSLYPVCGFLLSRYLLPRVIWLSTEPAQRIGEAQRAMLWLWPIQGRRFLREMRPDARPGEALSEAE